MSLRKELDESIMTLFRRRVLAQAERNRRFLQLESELEHTSTALQEVTGLGEDDINACFQSVQREIALKDDPFFSVPQQLAWVTIIALLLTIGVWAIS